MCLWETAGLGVSRGQCPDRNGLLVIGQPARMLAEANRLDAVAEFAVRTGGQDPSQVVQGFERVRFGREG